MEGKKSFVLYTDLIHTLRKLPKEKQADLFMMILEYVNDENPSTDDLLLEVAFEPIKRQLKRDLVKYRERAKRARENGKKGGRPPKERNPEEPRKPSWLFGNPEEPRKPDTVNDNVTVNDNDNDIKEGFSFEVKDSRECVSLTEEIASFFSVSEIRNQNQFMKIGNFVRYIEGKGNFEHLKKQFYGYKAAKQDPTYRHSIENYIGKPNKSYDDGYWNLKTWYETKDNNSTKRKRINRTPQ